MSPRNLDLGTTLSNYVVCVTSKASKNQPAHTAQCDQTLCLSLEYSMTVKVLIEHHLEFLHLKGGCTGSPEFSLVKMPHCWKSHVTALSLEIPNDIQSVA